MLSGRQRILALAMALIGGLAWWLQQGDEPVVQSNADKDRRPDYTVDNFTATEMDETGKPHRRLSAIELRHYADDDSKELQSPRLTIFEDTAPPWLVRSEIASIPGDSDDILLQGEVFIDRERGVGTRPMHLRTRELLVKRREDYAETDQPVHATSGLDWVTSKTGAEIWFGEDLRIKLLGRVRGKIALP
jgi:lipopolysaccharide export system protein LptC